MQAFRMQEDPYPVLQQIVQLLRNRSIGCGVGNEDIPLDGGVGAGLFSSLTFDNTFEIPGRAGCVNL